jgi:prephenate dehydrogenase
MRVTIIGGAGQMGKWLIHHFKALGYTVIASDSRISELRKTVDDLEIILENSNTTAVLDSDIVVIAVPIEQTAEVIREVSPHMRPNSVLCEISSIKQNLPDVLIEASENQIRPLCIHPMFGPGPRARIRPIVLIPIYDAESEKGLVEDLFPDYQVIFATAEEHDKSMAFVISLPYFINTILASVLAEEDLGLLQQLAGTTFSVQFMLMSSILFQSTKLHIALHSANEYVPETLSRFQSKLAQGLSHLVDDFSGFGEFIAKAREKVGENVNLEEKYKEMYRVLEIMKDYENMEVNS